MSKLYKATYEELAEQVQDTINTLTGGLHRLKGILREVGKREKNNTAQPDPQDAEKFREAMENAKSLVRVRPEIDKVDT